MKLFALVAALVTVCASGAILPTTKDNNVAILLEVEDTFEADPIDYETVPTIPGHNSHYVEGKSRYIWMPDDDGVSHLIDLHMPVNESTSETRDPWTSNEYWLYTRRNPTTPQRIFRYIPASIWLSNYNGNRPLRVIVHGFMSKGSSDVNTYITSAFLNFEDVNVIVVDWSEIANHYNYNKVAEEVREVGNAIGETIEWLLNNGGGNWNNVHLVGHSLGAHVVGNTGRHVLGRPIRVTGLDPAGPRFESNSLALRRTDGIYVEAIHTDGGLLGIFNPVANGDFYPNGGKNPQPGCRLSTCSHSRAWELFASSVRTDHFMARRCANLEEAGDVNWRCTGTIVRMGNGERTKNANGLYELRTFGAWPF